MHLHPRQASRLYAAFSLLAICMLGFVVARGYTNALAGRPFFELRTPALTEQEVLDNRPELVDPGVEELTLDIPDTPLPELTDVLPTPVAIQSTPDSSPLNVSYWVYPGPPACGTYAELQALGTVDELKPEYATLDPDGSTRLLRTIDAGCNALSSSNVEYYKSISDTQFITVSGSGENFSNLVTSPTKRTESIALLTGLVEQTDMTGIELDFEGFSGWTEADYAGYLTYLEDLGTELQDNDRQLMIDAPAIYNDGIQSVFQFKYSDISDLPVDYVTIMAYDYQYDYGGGAPVTEDQFLIDSIDRAKSELSNWQDRLVIGLPTYGYTATENEYRISIKTRDQIFDLLTEEERATATRIPSSEELIFRKDGQVYVWQDQQSIQHKIDIVQQQDISRIAIWHLGGNPLVEVQE